MWSFDLRLTDLGITKLEDNTGSMIGIPGTCRFGVDWPACVQFVTYAVPSFAHSPSVTFHSLSLSVAFPSTPRRKTCLQVYMETMDLNEKLALASLC